MDLFRQRLILIADDNHDGVATLAILLRLFGFEVSTVHRGNDALTVAKARKPDVLLLDIGLPDLDGYQVAARFKSDATLKSVLIIAISGYSPDMFPARSKREFDHYLVKPVDLKALLPLIRKTA